MLVQKLVELSRTSIASDICASRANTTPWAWTETGVTKDKVNGTSHACRHVTREDTLSCIAGSDRMEEKYNSIYFNFTNMFHEL